MSRVHNLAGIRLSTIPVALRFESPISGSVEFCAQHKTPKLKIRRILSNGAGGIRTPGALRHDGFQDRLLKPLGHRSRIGDRKVVY